jgi:hypothetical protein
VLAAQQRLETSAESIDEVADRVGLRTAATLRLHFRRALRTTPTAYRRRFSKVTLGLRQAFRRGSIYRSRAGSVRFALERVPATSVRIRAVVPTLAITAVRLREDGRRCR